LPARRIALQILSGRWGRDQQIFLFEHCPVSIFTIDSATSETLMLMYSNASSTLLFDFKKSAPAAAAGRSAETDAFAHSPSAIAARMIFVVPSIMFASPLSKVELSIQNFHGEVFLVHVPTHIGADDKHDHESKPDKKSDRSPKFAGTLRTL
jgi:hypothetical protein